MNYRKPTPCSGMPRQGFPRRYATAAIVLGGGAIIGSSALMNSYSTSQTNYGTPINYSGRQYYIPGDSKRVRYPSKDACMRDVPWDRQVECEPVSSYRGSSGGYYGPIYNSRDTTYRPNPQFPTEKADGSNTGKKLPKDANSHGFGSNGKAFTGSKGG